MKVIRTKLVWLYHTQEKGGGGREGGEARSNQQVPTQESKNKKEKEVKKQQGNPCKRRRGSSVIDRNYSIPPLFSFQIEGLKFWWSGKKTHKPHQFSILLSSPTNTHKINFFSTFLSFIFYPPYSTCNQTDPQCHTLVITQTCVGKTQI